jgi:ribosomal protein L11 methyltransferase
MQKYYFVKINDLEVLINGVPLGDYAIHQCNSTGIQNFSLDESMVDSILGDRSYSGADLPIEVIEEVEAITESKENKTYHIYFDTQEDAKCLTDELDKMKIPFELESKVTQDWNEEWKKNFSPIKFEDEFEIIPAWFEDYNLTTNKHIYIYPGMGFGTGSHETTYLCIKLYLEWKDKKINNTCMDFGCGSGILGLIYKIYNPSANIDLYDIDQAALDNCMQNIELNNIESSTIRLLLPEQRNQFLPTYDLVFANILKNILIEEAKQILKLVNSGGCLIASGLLVGQEHDIISHYTYLDSSLILENILYKGDWVALRFTKKA